MSRQWKNNLTTWLPESECNKVLRSLLRSSRQASQKIAKTRSGRKKINYKEVNSKIGPEQERTWSEEWHDAKFYGKWLFWQQCDLLFSCTRDTRRPSWINLFKLIFFLPDLVFAIFLWGLSGMSAINERKLYLHFPNSGSMSSGCSFHWRLITYNFNRFLSFFEWFRNTQASLASSE